ncbi:MAG: family peptidase, partial [Segetibacter sp.]|nr:family peptidase [Segetibacter sp.]
MRKIILIAAFAACVFEAFAQERMTPELLWKLGRVSGVGITKDSANVVFTVSTPNVELNKSSKKTYLIPIKGGAAKEIADSNDYVKNDRISPNGKYKISADDVKIKKVFGKDFYPELTKTTAQIYDQLGYRHWDEWEDGAFSHIFVETIGRAREKKDIMAGQPYDSPQKPFGGDEDFIWSPDGNVVYVTKPKAGTAYALSTNTDIFSYNVTTGTTTNLTEGFMGYDQAPAYSPQGKLAWLSMKREGYEADKQDIIVNTGTSKINLTQYWDGSVDGFKWSNDGKNIYFYAPVDGTLQLFVVDYPGMTMKVPEVKQITHGDFDVSGLIGQVGNTMVVTRTDMNHAAELYTVDLTTGSMKQLSHVNDEVFNKLAMGKFQRRYVTTTDNKKMLVWMMLPPNFDPSKKYPTLLYCQGGPQSPLTQFYSYRWNLQLMAASGYVIVAPNRRGMYGHGQQWNEAISKDWAGQVMKDYLS